MKMFDSGEKDAVGKRKKLDEEESWAGGDSVWCPGYDPDRWVELHGGRFRLGGAARTLHEAIHLEKHRFQTKDGIAFECQYH